MYPQLTIDLGKFEFNLNYIVNLCSQHGISVMAVTKVFCADPRLIDIVNKSSVEYIADSRLMNLKSIMTDKPKVLLRIPSIHEAEEIIKYVDVSLNSELQSLKVLNDEAKKLDVKHKSILMVDVGDLREGVYHKENIVNIIDEIGKLKNIELIGIGTNLTCYGGIIPNRETLNKLFDVINLIKITLDVEFNLVTGGNSSHIHLLLEDNKIPYINNLRIGEAIVLGRETAYGRKIEGMHQDVFTLEADLIEIKYKPSIPEGIIGMNAFGEKPQFENLGLMKRGIIGIGRQDVDFHEIQPVDDKIRFVGSSSDHIIIDLTHTDQDYKVGDVLKFKVSYGSLLSLMTSKYVRKTYVK